MNKHLFKLLFGALFLVAATAFTGCSDDDDKNSETPKLSVSTKTLNFTEGSETTQTVAIKANCGWKVVKTSLDWATVTPAEGKGNGQIAVSVGELPAGTTSRTGKISFTLIHPEFGPWGEAEGQTITVTQSSGDTPTPPVGEALYSENAGTATFKKADYGGNWPFADKYEKWTRGGTLDQSGVTYGGSNSSVRCSGDDYEPNAADDISGAPYVNVKTFEIKNINIASNRNFTFTFVAQNTASTLSESPYTPTFGDITASSFNFSVSMDGTTYSKVAFVPVKSNSSWYKCTAQFKLPAAATTSTISVRFDGFNGGTTLRTDDFNLYEGGNGTEIGGDDPGPIDPTKTAIGNIKTAGAYETEGTIVARGKMAYIIADNTGSMMVYHKDNERSVGEKITIKGDVTIFNASSTPQFSEAAEVSVVSAGNSWTYNPTVLDAAAMDALAAASPVCKEVQFEGTMAISGTNVNVTIDGAATAIGSIKYIDNATISSLDGQKVVVKGYFVGVSASKYVNVLPYSVEESGAPAEPKISSVSPASLSFAAAGEAKDVTVTLNSAAQGLNIEATSDNGQFTAAVSDTKVTVTAKENTTAAAIKGTLTVKLMKNGSAVDTKTVVLTQAAKSQGGGTETTVTMDLSAIDAGKIGGYGLFENSYQDKEGTMIQDINNSDTWYQWTVDGASFAGYHICKANATDYVGTLQMQGHASDAKKQGFFGNVTDLGKITKIVVVSKNTKYAPTEHLYMGTEANPAGNAQTSTIDQEGQVYTETFNIDGDYGFFKLHNDKAGAFYVQSISITYTK